MILRLQSPTARAVLVFVAGALAVAMTYFSIREAMAFHASQVLTLEGYQRAVQLEPKNARYWYLLGRYWQLSMDSPDPQQAIRDFKTSLQLDPHSADTWMDLATVYDSEGDAPAARDAFLAAKRAYPASAEVAWRYGNFLLRQGEFSTAYAEIRTALEADPKRGAEAFSRCWRVSPDVHTILDKVLPPSKEIYVAVIRELVEAGQLDPALVVWSRLGTLNPRMSPAQVPQLTNALLQQGRSQELSLVWQQVVAMMDDPPADPPGSVFWDGGFESDVINSGLAWRIPPPYHGVKASIETGQVHSGKHALRIMFTGDVNVRYEGPCHYALVSPGTTYRFSAWVRPEGLTTNQGIRFQLETVVSGVHKFAVTADAHGSEPWTNVTYSWTAPEDASLVKVCIERGVSDSPDGDIQGTAWVDDVSLVPVSDQVTKP
jgi:tetratricopeptide (TPR) repeat protein